MTNCSSKKMLSQLGCRFMYKVPLTTASSCVNLGQTKGKSDCFFVVVVVVVVVV